MKKVDITEKLEFDENPRLVINGQEFEVNADAMSMFKVMQSMSGDNPSIDDVMSTYETLFPESERKRLEEMKLKFVDFKAIIHLAISLVTGASEETGEQ